jgi:aminoglycoside phosphotransferase (APT) family kinase protein
MVPTIDEAGPVREGETLDAGKLADFLFARLPDASGPVEVAQFRHGHSNLTYLVRVGGREFVLRRPPFGNRVKSAHDMGREFHVLDKLCGVYPPAPRPLVYCDDESILGCPFYVMERRRGVILRGGPAVPSPDPATLRDVSGALVDSLAVLHAIDPNAAGLADLGRPEGYVGRQIAGWSKRYHDAKTEELPDLERVAAWLDASRPGESGAAVIHNDFKFDNVILDPADPSRVVAVLDWEMATVGDPLMDLGTTLGYWVEPGDPEPLHRMVVGPTIQPGCLTRREVVARYERATGRAVRDVLFYYVYGLFKIAVIVQQIYSRYARGATSDPRFASLGQVVAAIGRGACLALERGEV